MIANEVTKRLRRAGFDAHAVHRMRKGLGSSPPAHCPPLANESHRNSELKSEARKAIGGDSYHGHLASEFTAPRK